MIVKLCAQLFMPGTLQWIGGANPAIATFEGEYDLKIERPKDLTHLFEKRHHFCDCDFQIVIYREEENQLVLKGDIRALNIAGVEAFLEAHIAHHPGWTINKKELDCYARNSR